MEINVKLANSRTMMHLFPTVYDYYSWIILGIGKRFVIPMLTVGKNCPKLKSVGDPLDAKGFFGTRTEARNVMQHEHHQLEKHKQNMPTHFIGRKALK